jgi:hypothetical protein
MPAWACRLRQQRRETLHPAEDADVIDDDATLGQQLLDIPVRERIQPARVEVIHQRNGARRSHLCPSRRALPPIDISTRLIWSLEKLGWSGRAVAHTATAGQHHPQPTPHEHLDV